MASTKINVFFFVAIYASAKSTQVFIFYFYIKLYVGQTDAKSYVNFFSRSLAKSTHRRFCTFVLV